MRRWIAGAAAGLGLLLAAPAARADGPQWDGSRNTTPTVVSSESFVITAQFVRSNGFTQGMPIVGTSLTIPSGLPAGCDQPGPRTLQTQGTVSGTTANTAAPASVACNGTYAFEVVATVKRTLQSDDVKRLPGTITVAAPPPDVEGVDATQEGPAVVITWHKLSDEPADFTGYRVERQDASGKYTTIATLGPNSPTTFTDNSPPPEGGEVVYRVRATRSGPNGDIASEGGGRDPVTLPVPTTTTTPGATDAGTTDGGTAGTGGTAGADGGATTGGTGGTKSTPRFVTPRARTNIGISAPRLGQSTGSGLLLEPPDEGFDEEIDYGELPGADEEAGDDLEIFDESTGRGLAVPIGIGAVLFGWGLHLFMLARAARPATIAVPVLDEVYDDPAYDEPTYGGSTYGSSSTSYGSSTAYGSGYGATYSSYTSDYEP